MKQWKATVWSKEEILRRTTVRTSGCWEARAIDRDGYARQVSVQGRLKKLHRLSYEYFIGPFDPSLNIDHLCKNKRCCNPWHLEPVSIQENIKRRTLVLSPVCKRGHHYTPENTAIITNKKTGTSHRACKRCIAQYFRDRRKRIKMGVDSFGTSRKKAAHIKRVKKGPRKRIIWDLARIKELAFADLNGCWLWPKTNKEGYPMSRRFNSIRLEIPHRFTYSLVHGPIPVGMHLDHLCRVRACVNPGHMEVVSLQENNRGV
jgi:hypothetical protein